MNTDFRYGLRRGMPIALGYVPVAFTFGLMVVSGGLSPRLAIFISLTNLTSAGQFAGTNLILAGASYLEITLTTLVINIRYMLMSFSLSQKMKPQITLGQRLIFGFGITDETFSVAAVEQGKLSFEYILGLIILPIVGWTSGTALGALICTALPSDLSNAMGIALYAMFIAIIAPVVKKTRSVFLATLIAVVINVLLKYVTLFSFISQGFRVIIAAIIAALLAAYVYPMCPDNNETGEQ